MSAAAGTTGTVPALRSAVELASAADSQGDAAGHTSLPARALMLPIRAWRVLSVRLPPRCRFYPSCSQYALEALEIHGAVRGGWLAVRRVGRCHPWHDGGFDPVPRPGPVHPDHSTNVRSTDSPGAPAPEER